MSIEGLIGFNDAQGFGGVDPECFKHFGGNNKKAHVRKEDGEQHGLATSTKPSNGEAVRFFIKRTT